MINLFSGMGRLTSDVELKSTKSGKSVSTFTIAIDRRFTKATDFIPCVAWESTADFISKYFHKGDMIAIVGELQSGSYEDSNGNKRTKMEVNVTQASFCGGKKEEKSDEEFSVLPDSDDNDLPF